MGVEGIESFHVPYQKESEDRATSLIARKGATCNSLGAGIVR